MLRRGSDGRWLRGVGLKRLSALHLSLHPSPTHRDVSEKAKCYKKKGGGEEAEKGETRNTYPRKTHPTTPVHAPSIHPLDALRRAPSPPQDKMVLKFGSGGVFFSQGPG